MDVLLYRRKYAQSYICTEVCNNVHKYALQHNRTPAPSISAGGVGERAVVDGGLGGGAGNKNTKEVQLRCMGAFIDHIYKQGNF